MLGKFEEQPRPRGGWNSDWNRAGEERGREDSRCPQTPCCVPGQEETAGSIGAPCALHGHTGWSGTEDRKVNDQTFQSLERPLREITRESGWVNGATEGTASDKAWKVSEEGPSEHKGEGGGCRRALHTLAPPSSHEPLGGGVSPLFLFYRLRRWLPRSHTHCPQVVELGSSPNLWGLKPC